MIDWITLTSIFFGAVPLVLSALTLPTLKFAKGMFALLLVGFAADLFNLFSQDLQIDRQFVWDAYSIFECSVLIWIVRYRKNALTFKSFVISFAMLSFPLWLICQYVYARSYLFTLIDISPLSLFIIVYQVYVMFHAAREVLTLSEQEENLTAAPSFWIFIGIFFYSIGTFFIMSFLSKPIILYKMYYINNVVNIITHLLYSIGFCCWLFGRSRASDVSQTR